MSYENNQPHEYGWNDEIENDSSFVLLPEGEYNFRVTGFERGVHEPKEGGKLPRCPKADLTLEVDDGNGNTATIYDTLYLHSKCEGQLCAFFTAIGQRKKGERIRMNWGAVLGAAGRAKIYVDKYNGKEKNKVKRYLEPEEAPEWVAEAQTAPQTSGKSWGSF